MRKDPVVVADDRERAVRGSIEARLLLRLPADLAKKSRAAAKREGVSLVEWWRRAGLERLERGGR